MMARETVRENIPKITPDYLPARPSYTADETTSNQEYGGGVR